MTVERTETEMIVMKTDLIENTDKNQTKEKQKQVVKSYANDPFFVKKGKESKEFFDKQGFPKELLKK